jgi:hypothetical protein
MGVACGYLGCCDCVYTMAIVSLSTHHVTPNPLRFCQLDAGATYPVELATMPTSLQLEIEADKEVTASIEGEELENGSSRRLAAILDDADEELYPSAGLVGLAPKSN